MDGEREGGFDHSNADKQELRETTDSLSLAPVQPVTIETGIPLAGGNSSRLLW